MNKKTPAIPARVSVSTSVEGTTTIPGATVSLVATMSYNVEQDLILVTEDKLKICLQSHVNTLGQQAAWLVPFGIFLTIASTLYTSTFKDLAHLKADQVQTIYFVGAVVTIAWTCWKLPAAFRRTTVNKLILQIKEGSVRRTPPPITPEAAAPMVNPESAVPATTSGKP